LHFRLRPTVRIEALESAEQHLDIVRVFNVRDIFNTLALDRDSSVSLGTALAKSFLQLSPIALGCDGDFVVQLIATCPKKRRMPLRTWLASEQRISRRSELELPLIKNGRG
jgi:hypothetical protein